MDWIFVLVSAFTAMVESEEVRWAMVLDGLDDVRAEAFAHGDPRRLDDVYAAGSSARDADAALIRAYARRGGRVVGAELDILSCTPRRVTAERVSLAVVDRLATARVEWEDGTSRALPRDLPTRRVVTLVRTPEGWRIA